MSTAILIVASASDCVERARILVEEVTHLTSLIRHRLSTAQNSQAQYHDYIGGVYAHMLKSTTLLGATCETGLIDATFLESEAKGIVEENAGIRRTTDRTPLPLLNCFLTINALRANQTDLVTALAELHARFEQSLKFSIPDHPTPSVRSGRDSSIADRYYTELARFTYRDLSRFVSEAAYLNSGLPHRMPPRIFVTTGYQPNSKNFAFASAHAHEEWASWYEGSLDKAPNGTKQNTNADELPERFVSVRLPFFLPDMLEQMPIIGHEIAHAVLSDLYGQLGGGSWLQFSESTVAKYMNALVLTYKGWIGDESVRSALPNVVEVVADAFAMVRFRGAFLYSAFMTAFESSTLSGMATDEFGKSMISTWIESVRQSKAENRNRKWGSHDARSFFRHHAKGDQIEITNVLLRLLVLSLTTANVNSNDADTATVQLSEGVTSICKDVLQILHEDEFAIAGVLDDDSPTIKSIGRLAEALARINFENLGPAIERFWKPVTNGNSGNGQVYEDYFLDLQRLSSKQSAAWTKYCESQGYESRTSDFATDFFWKRKWARATNSVTTSRALGAPNSDVLLPLAVMEDYLNRTMSSKQLFNQLMLRNSANKTSCPTFFAVFGGNSVIGNVTSGSDHRQFVVQPSKEILQYLKTGNWTSGWFSSIHWDRESIVGTSAMINGSWPSIGPHDLAYRLTLISSSALNPKSSYPDQSMVVLLGRYDVATLTPLEDESCKSSGDDPTYSRRVVWLAPVDANVGKAAPPTMANVLGLMFIALASPMSWRILVTWLDLKIRKDLAQSKIIVHCMVSDGWEHVVILFEHLDIKKADMTPIQSVLDAVTTIRNHPCVVRTETIFCKSVLGLSSLRDNGLHVSVRFRCRAKSSNSVSSVDLLRHIKNPREVKEVIAGKEVIKEVNDFDKKFKGIEIVVRLLTGLTDFEVRLTVPHSREKKRFEAIRFVHDRLNAPESPISRLQSQIAF